MRRIVAALVLGFSLIGPASAQSVNDLNAYIENVLGDHTKYEAAFAAFQQAVARDDRDAVAALAAYPLIVTVGERREIGSASEFVGLYDEIMTEEIVRVVRDQTYGGLFANDQGVMFGIGEVWMAGVCEDDSCDVWDVKVITIQSTTQ